MMEICFVLRLIAWQFGMLLPMIFEVYTTHIFSGEVLSFSALKNRAVCCEILCCTQCLRTRSRVKLLNLRDK